MGLLLAMEAIFERVPQGKKNVLAPAKQEF